MYSKIAFKNVKKSFKDYTIYFFTLMLAVCIFYTFNSVESQKAMSELTSSGESYVEILSKVISYVSVFIAFIIIFVPQHFKGIADKRVVIVKYIALV